MRKSSQVLHRARLHTYVTTPARDSSQVKQEVGDEDGRNNTPIYLLQIICKGPLIVYRGGKKVPIFDLSVYNDNKTMRMPLCRKAREDRVFNINPISVPVELSGSPQLAHAISYFPPCQPCALLSVVRNERPQALGVPRSLELLIKWLEMTHQCTANLKTACHIKYKKWNEADGMLSLITDNCRTCVFAGKDHKGNHIGWLVDVKRMMYSQTCFSERCRKKKMWKSIPAVIVKRVRGY